MKPRKNIFRRIQEAVVVLISKLTWRGNTFMPAEELDKLRDMFRKDYYIIATRRKNSVAAFFINLGHFLLRGRWGYYTHVLMNAEETAVADDDFRFVEATTHGTQYSTFSMVTDDIDAIALLKPHSMTLEEWTACLDGVKEYLGRPYDNLFNLKNDYEINCVELIRLALQKLPDYSTRFAAFEAMCSKYKTITPQMFLECPDFHKVYEVRS